MKLTRTAALIVAALVVGLVAGNVMSVSAAPSSDATNTTVAAGLGLRLGAAMRDAGGRLADVVATLTGQDAEDVQEQRAAGTSFADIAAAKGVDSADVVDAALDVRRQILADRVEAGALTQEQADDALERMSTRLTDRVTSTDAGCSGAGGGMMGGRGGRGGMGGRGAGGGACGGVCTQNPPVTQ